MDWRAASAGGHRVEVNGITSTVAYLVAAVDRKAEAAEASPPGRALGRVGSLAAGVK